MNASPLIAVRPVRTAADRDEFIRVAWRAQSADPLWVPPIAARQRAFLDPRSGPFFTFGEAELFLAERDGRAVGRISAHVNRRHDEAHGAGTGFFGFFECLPEEAAADALFAAAAGWLSARGRVRMLGPLGFTVYDEVGLLVDGFDTLPAILLTHNPPYYAGLLARQGFRKSVDWHALRVTNRDVDPEAMSADSRALMRDCGLRLRVPHPREVVRRAVEIRDLFNEAWKGNWGHVPMTPRQFATVLDELRPLLRPDLLRIVEDGEGRIVAFTITIPDLNPLLREFDGRLNPWRILRLYRAARWRPLRRVKTVLLGVARARRNLRLHEAMILDTYAHLIRTQPELEQGDCSLICEQLRVFIRSLERFGARPYKTYRIFEKDLEPRTGGGPG